MYEQFYNLRERPFSLTPDPEYLYLSRVHTEALNYLRYGIEGHAGFIVLTGEIGSGKTTLLQTLVRKLDRQTSISRIVNTLLEPRELIEAVMLDFGLEAEPGRGKPHLLRDLARYLVEQRNGGRLAQLVIDEAQNLSAAALEEVRMLSNLETEKSKLIQIALVGQPSLRDKLARPELQQLRQRISVSYHLRELDPPDTAAYINHRLRRAARATPLVFPPSVTDLVHARSQGLPRRINTIADAILLFAYGEGQRTIGIDAAREAIAELETTGIIEPLSETRAAGQQEAAPRSIRSSTIRPATLPLTSAEELVRDGNSAEPERRARDRSTNPTGVRTGETAAAEPASQLMRPEEPPLHRSSSVEQQTSNLAWLDDLIAPQTTASSTSSYDAHQQFPKRPAPERIVMAPPRPSANSNARQRRSSNRRVGVIAATVVAGTAIGVFGFVGAGSFRPLSRELPSATSSPPTAPVLTSQSGVDTPPAASTQPSSSVPTQAPSTVSTQSASAVTTESPKSASTVNEVAPRAATPSARTPAKSSGGKPDPASKRTNSRAAAVAATRDTRRPDPKASDVKAQRPPAAPAAPPVSSVIWPPPSISGEAQAIARTPPAPAGTTSSTPATTTSPAPPPIVTPSTNPPATPTPPASAAAAPSPAAEAPSSSSSVTPSATGAAEPSASRVDENSVREVLSRYVAAYNRLDAPAAKTVWPSVDAAALGRAFNRLESQQVEFSGCQISVAVSRAVASCAGNARYVPKVGNKRTKVEPRRWTFDLTKANNRWTIATVNAQ